MKLIEDWHFVMRRAWSARLMIIAALLSGAETVVPLFFDAMPRGPFALLSFITVIAAFIARFVAQRNMSGDE